MHPLLARRVLPSYATTPLAPFRGRLSEAGFLELSDISREEDPSLRAEAIFHLAQKEEQEGQLEGALDLYSSLETVEFRARAQERSDAILGRGAIGGRAEFLMRRLAGEAVSPSALVSMAVGLSVFRLTKLSVLSRLAAGSSSNLFTRGVGARVIAGIAGFAVEAPAFTLSTRLVRASLGEKISHSSLGEDLASSYLMLGAMKLGASFGNALSSRLSHAGGIPANALRQSFALGGLLLGHRLEEFAGLKTPQSGAITLIDSLATLLQFHVGGRLNDAVFGQSFVAWENRMAIANRRLRPPAPPTESRIFPNFSPSFAVAGDPQGIGIFMMGSKDSQPPSVEPVTQVYPLGERTMRITDLYNILLGLRSILRLPQPAMVYDGTDWQENRDARTIAGRLRHAIPLPKEKTFELELRQQGQHISFFWEGEEVKYRVENLAQPQSATLLRQPVSGTSETLPAMPAVQAPLSPRSAGLYRFRFDAANNGNAGEGRQDQSASVLFGLREYEAEMNRGTEELYRLHVPKNSVSSHWPEEASALRGRRLASIANLVFRPENTGDTARSIPAAETAVKIQCLLEQAYRHLDFDTIHTFRERISSKTSESFGEAIQLVNLRLEREGVAPLLLPEDMPIELGARHLIPRTLIWRDAFLAELFKIHTPEQLPRAIPALLSDPRNVAAAIAPVFQTRMQETVHNGTRLQAMRPRETLKELLDPERDFESESARDLQKKILQLAGELPEISRILVEGRGKPQREFLRALFFDGETPLQGVYPNFLRVMGQIPQAVTGLDGKRLFLPTLAQIRDFTHPSRPPQR